MKIIDISISLGEKIPYWPGSSGVKIRQVSDMEKGGVCNETSIDMNSHVGTHIDAPRHFLPAGKAIDQMHLSVFMGSVFVVHLPRAKKITSVELEKVKIPNGIRRILFKTSNSSLWKKRVSKFTKKYVGITPDAAIWLSKRDLVLIGVDYLSVADFDEAAAVHEVLFKENIALLEGINLTKATQGMYELICFPIKASGLEASPVRAVLIKK